MVAQAKSARARVKQEEPSKPEGRFLTGMKEISKYVNRSQATVIRWIKNKNFPAKKIDGVWESHTGKIDDWRMRRWEAA